MLKRSQAAVANAAVNAYVNGNELVILTRQGDKLIRRTQPAEHTCFIKAADLSREQLRELSTASVVKTVRRDGDFFRLIWKDSDALRRLTSKDGLFDKKEIQTYEGDVDPVRRWLTDNPITIQRPRRCYLDIESDSRVNFAQKLQARMLVWSVTDGDTGETFDGCLNVDTIEDERRLLLELWKVLDRFDQVCAWAGAWFDFPFLQARTEACAISIDVRRWLWLDHMVLFRRMNVSASESGEEKQSMALTAVAKVILGEGKLELDEEDLSEIEETAEDQAVTMGALSWDMWATSERTREKLVRYCRRDSELMFEIEIKTGYVEMLFTICQICGVFANTLGVNPTQQVDGYLLRLVAAAGMRGKTKQFMESTEQFAGAYVLDPAPGLHTDEVHVCDFAGMYPSIIISWNMSPETYRPGVILKEDTTFRPSYYAHLPAQEWPIPDGHCAAALTDKVFALEPIGILPAALIEVRKLRKEWTKKKALFAPGTPEWKEADRRSTGYKIIANTFYGVIGSPFSRFFERAVAESTAQTGKWLILATKKAAEDRGWQVIYIDTDALYVKGCSREEFKAFCTWCNVELYPKLLASRKCTTNVVELEYEKAFARIVFTSKKRYAGMFSHYKFSEATADSKPEIKGLEYKRGDTLKLARDLQRDVAYRLVGFQCTPVDDANEFDAQLEAAASRIFDEPIAKEHAVLSKKLSKPLHDYVRKTKNAPPMHKLRGESVHVAHADHECKLCGATPATMLSVNAGKCEQDGCGGELRRRRSSTKGVVLRYIGDRIAIADGRKCTLVLIDAIEDIVCYAAQPEHVTIAHTLAARGQNVSKGVRIEYVITDCDDPFGAIPASDWAGECDRYKLWEMIYHPTQRLLQAAFPKHDWKKHERMKPSTVVIAGKSFVSAAKKRPKKEAKTDGQGSLF